MPPSAIVSEQIFHLVETLIGIFFFSVIKEKFEQLRYNIAKFFDYICKR